MTPEQIVKRHAERKRWHTGIRVKPTDSDDQQAMRREAVTEVAKAIRDGWLTPWPVCAVWSCNQRRVQAHHVCYDLFWRLRVIWLCRRCHHQLYAEHRKYVTEELARKLQRNRANQRFLG